MSPFEAFVAETHVAVSAWCLEPGTVAHWVHDEDVQYLSGYYIIETPGGAVVYGDDAGPYEGTL